MVPLENITVGELLRRTVERFPRRPALEHRGRAWTYGELDRETDALAAGMLARGMGQGAHLGFWAADTPATLFCLYAALKIGAVPVLLGACGTPAELAARLEEADAAWLLHDHPPDDKEFSAVLGSLPGVLLGKSCPGGQDLNWLRKAGDAVSREALAAAKAAVRPGDPDMILFTSGTTDRPKGVVTTHFARANNAMAQADILEAVPEDKFLCALPTFHCFSLSGNVLAAMAAGACLCLPEDRRTATLLRAVEQWHCTILTAVPTLFSALLARLEGQRFDLSTLRAGLIGGSIYPPELFRRVCTVMGYDLLPSLGLTEATAGITAGAFHDTMAVRAGTVGRFLPHVEGRILDGQGNPLPPGQTGEVCVRGYTVMGGYYKSPELTARVIDGDGWLHTGDLGLLDESGNLVLTGRCKQVIIRGGENIAPGEIERVIGGEPRVAAVCVVGVPDPHYGEELCACVVRAAGAEITAEEIRAHTAGQLAAFKVPRRVLFWERLPVTGSGKVDAARVRALAIEHLEGCAYETV